MSTPSDIQTLLGMAGQQLEIGDKQQAKQRVSEVLKIDAKNAEAWYLASFLTDSPVQQVRALENALATDPQHTKAQQRLIELRPGKDWIDDLLFHTPAAVVERKKKRRRRFTATIRLLMSVLVLWLVVISLATIVTKSTDQSLHGKIAFVSERDTKQQIYVMNVDGTHQINLTHDTGSNNAPAWSPDGKRIAYQNEWGAICVMNADGSNYARLTDAPLFSFDGDPAWSPDATYIAFASRRDGNWEIYVMNADGTGQVKLTNNLAEDTSPAWSPDGKHIAFVSTRDDNQEIYVMGRDGSNPTNLTNSIGLDAHPTWSPDGKQIAFTSKRDGIYEIYVMNADGSNQIRLTNTMSGDPSAKPSWSPDGKHIAFEAYVKDSNYEIYVMNADGSSSVRLTNSPGNDWQPVWAPQ